MNKNKTILELLPRGTDFTIFCPHKERGWRQLTRVVISGKSGVFVVHEETASEAIFQFSLKDLRKLKGVQLFYISLRKTQFSGFGNEKKRPTDQKQ